MKFPFARMRIEAREERLFYISDVFSNKAKTFAGIRICGSTELAEVRIVRI
jgi:hypothetical protein